VSKQTLLNLGKYLLAFALLGWVIHTNWDPPGGKGLGYVWQRHIIEGQPIHWNYFLIAFLCYLGAVVLTLLRWYVLVRAQDLPFRVYDAIRLGLVGLFFNTFLPGSVGGDIIKAAVLAREQSRRTVAVATVIMDRLIALWAMFWFMAILGAIFWANGALEGEGGERAKYIVEMATLVVGISVVVWLLLGLLPQDRAERFAGRLSRRRRVGHAAAEFWRAVWMYRCRQPSVVVAMLMASVGFVGFVLAFYYAALTLWDAEPNNPIPTLSQHFLLVPIGLIVQAVIPLPGGVGIGEFGFGELYKWLQCQSANGVLGSLVQRVITWVLGLLGYLIYLRMRSTLPANLASDTAQEEELRALANGESRCQPAPEPFSAG
jgi:uncharacterized protein (TIRG00374 family)